MMLSTIDIALRSAAVALLLVLAVSLFRGFGTVLAGRLAAAFALGSAAHAVTSSIGATSPASAALAPAIALSTGNVVVFWLFARALYDDGFRLRWWHGLIWGAVVVLSLANCLFIAPAATMGTKGTSFVAGEEVMAIISAMRIPFVAINLVVLGFIALAVVQTI